LKNRTFYHGAKRNRKNQEEQKKSRKKTKETDATSSVVTQDDQRRLWQVTLRWAVIFI